MTRAGGPDRTSRLLLGLAAVAVAFAAADTYVVVLALPDMMAGANLSADELQRGAVLSALIVSASGATDPHELRGWAHEVQRIDASHPTGLGGLMRWLTPAWHGDIPASVDVCLEAASDERLPRASRDLFVGIAVLDHFSLTAGPDARPGLVERARKAEALLSA